MVVWFRVGGGGAGPEVVGDDSGVLAHCGAGARRDNRGENRRLRQVLARPGLRGNKKEEGSQQLSHFMLMVEYSRVLNMWLKRKVMEQSSQRKIVFSRQEYRWCLAFMDNTHNLRTIAELFAWTLSTIIFPHDGKSLTSSQEFLPFIFFTLKPIYLLELPKKPLQTTLRTHP